MLLIPTIVKKSNIDGYGLFTMHKINKGTPLWKFVDGVDWKIPDDVLDEFPDNFRQDLVKWSYHTNKNSVDGRWYWVFCQDNAKFMNHHAQPNCDDWSDPLNSIAARDIEEGEELTCNYECFYQNPNGSKQYF